MRCCICNSLHGFRHNKETAAYQYQIILMRMLLCRLQGFLYSRIGMAVKSVRSRHGGQALLIQCARYLCLAKIIGSGNRE